MAYLTNELSHIVHGSGRYTHVVLERLLAALAHRRLWRCKNLFWYSKEIRRDGSVAGEMTEILLTRDVLALHGEAIVPLRLLDCLLKY